MRFYQYWARATEQGSEPDGQPIFRTANGNSDISFEDAVRVAKERARRMVDFANRGQSNRDDYYPAGERPIREEVVETFADRDQPFAIISRNAYGCLVLNTSDVFFADVDERSLNPLKRLWAWLTRKVRLPLEQRLLQSITELIQTDAGLAFRLYRTLAGYRVVLTSRTLPADDSSSRSFPERLGSDKLYVSLCRSQDCYRARLTPKPWRCGSEKPLQRFPFDTPEAESRYRKWENSYNAIAKEFATCALVGSFGSASMHPRVASVLELHDHYVLNGDKSLA